MHDFSNTHAHTVGRLIGVSAVVRCGFYWFAVVVAELVRCATAPVEASMRVLGGVVRRHSVFDIGGDWAACRLVVGSGQACICEGDKGHTHKMSKRRGSGNDGTCAGSALAEPERKAPRELLYTHTRDQITAKTNQRTRTPHTHLAELFN